MKGINGPGLIPGLLSRTSSLKIESNDISYADKSPILQPLFKKSENEIPLSSTAPRKKIVAYEKIATTTIDKHAARRSRMGSKNRLAK